MIGSRRNTLKVINVGHERYRIGPWRGARDVGYVAPLSSVTGYGVDRACEKLHQLGYEHVITAALSATEQRHFLTRGFTRREGLHLLRHDLRRSPARARRLSPDPSGAAAPTVDQNGTQPNPAHEANPEDQDRAHEDRAHEDRAHVSQRRGRKRDRARVLEIDGAAFDPFWRLDENGLEEAIGATPASRFRIATIGSVIVGYAVSGRTRDTGYLQRLAVDPDYQGHGIGTALLADCLKWASRSRTTAVLVNTQERNEGAFRLYRSHGFEPMPDGLAVLERAALG